MDFDYLISNSLAPQLDDEIFQRAKRRRLIGNPPGKSDSTFHIGDEIVWETILRDYTYDDIFIISNDGDWADMGINDKEVQLSTFLKSEFSSKSDKKIKLENNLGKFINENFKTVKKIPDEEIKKEEAITSAISKIPLSLAGWNNGGWGSSGWGGVLNTNELVVDNSSQKLSGLNTTGKLDSISSHNLTIPQSWKCSQCGVQNNSTITVCSYCGANKSTIVI